MKIVQIAIATDSDGNDSVYGLSEDGDLYYRAYAKEHFGQHHHYWCNALGKIRDITPINYVAELIVEHNVKTITALLNFKNHWEKSEQHAVNKVDLIGNDFVVTCVVHAEGWKISCDGEELKLPFGGPRVSY